MAELEPPIIASQPHHDRYKGVALGMDLPIQGEQLIILAAHQDDYAELSMMQRFGETEAMHTEKKLIQGETGQPQLRERIGPWLKGLKGVEEGENYLFTIVRVDRDIANKVMEVAHQFGMLVAYCAQGTLEEQVVKDRRERLHFKGLTSQLYGLAATYLGIEIPPVNE